MHYSLAVITRDPPEETSLSQVLAPFNENDNRYIENVSILADIRKDYPTLSDSELMVRVSEIYGFPVVHVGYVERCHDPLTGEIHPLHMGGWIEYSFEQVKIIDVIQRTNPHAKWDWYSIGGRWGGSLLTKSNQRCDSCQIKELDFECEIERLRLEATALYDSFEEHIDIADRVWRSWDDIRNDNSIPKYPDKFELYNSQPINRKSRKSGGWFFETAPTDLYLRPREEFISLWSSRPFQTFAVFIEDEQNHPHKGWYELGVSDYLAKEPIAKFKELLASQPDNYYITIIDYHS